MLWKRLSEAMAGSEVQESEVRKMNKKNNSSSGGIGATLLQTVFIVLKLCKVINWSWWWVLSPIWISIAIALIYILICLVLGIIVEMRADR